MTDSLVREVEEFYARYMDAFNGRDRHGFVSSFAYPCGLLFGNALAVQATEADMRTFFDNAMAGLASVGWSRSSIGPLQVWAYSDVLAQVVVDISRHRDDGAVFDRGRAVYMVGRGPEGWKILTLTEMKAPYADAAVTFGAD